MAPRGCGELHAREDHASRAAARLRKPPLHRALGERGGWATASDWVSRQWGSHSRPCRKRRCSSHSSAKRTPLIGAAYGSSYRSCGKPFRRRALRTGRSLLEFTPLWPVPAILRRASVRFPPAGGDSKRLPPTTQNDQPGSGATLTRTPHVRCGRGPNLVCTQSGGRFYFEACGTGGPLRVPCPCPQHH
jgi:hypothetical protein